MKKDEAGLRKAKAHERILFVTRRRGEDEVNVGSLAKTPWLPKKIRGRDKFLNRL
jgi:hypothetical protein